jgi:hypothetical protein
MTELYECSLPKLSQSELEMEIRVLRVELQCLRALAERDRKIMYAGNPEDHPEGKLRPRMARSRARRREYGGRLAAAEREQKKRRSMRRNDWAEPTVTDEHRFAGALRAG